jgi:hypothetical protein
LWTDFKLQRRPSGQVTLRHALRIPKALDVVDGEAIMVPRQAALWERVQCLTLGDGETLIAHLNHFRST